MMATLVTILMLSVTAVFLWICYDACFPKE